MPEGRLRVKSQTNSKTKQRAPPPQRHPRHPQPPTPTPKATHATQHPRSRVRRGIEPRRPALGFFLRLSPRSWRYRRAALCVLPLRRPLRGMFAPLRLPLIPPFASGALAYGRRRPSPSPARPRGSRGRVRARRPCRRLWGGRGAVAPPQPVEKKCSVSISGISQRVPPPPLPPPFFFLFSVGVTHFRYVCSLSAYASSLASVS